MRTFRLLGCALLVIEQVLIIAPLAACDRGERLEEKTGKRNEDKIREKREQKRRGRKRDVEERVIINKCK
jgi:hypothetical protein